MEYNFDKVWDRHNMDSIKWDDPKNPQHVLYTQNENYISMSVADMDFATAPCVVGAITERLAHPLFGYCDFPNRYKASIINWHTKHYHLDGLKEEHILYQNSVLGGLSTFLSIYTAPGEKILMNSPAYTGFQRIIKNLGRMLCCSPLEQDEKGIFRINFLDMESKMEKENISAMIFCSPHNPTGRVWERWEIEKVVALCNKYKVKIISDEIWADFVMDKSKHHIPTQSVNEIARDITMALYAPSKTFNTGGLFGAYTIIYDRQMMNKITNASIACGYNEKNLLACYALIGEYENGEEWVRQLLTYIRGNQEYMVDYINKNFMKVRAYCPEGTYLLWIDVRECGLEASTLFTRIKEAGVILNRGADYLDDGYLRLNAACPRSYCEEVMRRLAQVFNEKRPAQ